MSHIEIEKPEPRYENQRLRGEVNLTIGEGENAVIIGPNGSGKSLLSTYISGGVSLKSGRVAVLRA
ncbi:MAG: ATP-binding cassette domain-containing protein, partial [Bacteroidales bacterium]|nr:ATP-binding cassette domain-containing protein [Bacteroidales bacterium]